MKINQIAHLSEGVAGPKNCWPGYKKTGTQPGTGKNKGKRVNDCEKIKQQGVAEQWEPVSGYDTIYPRAKVIKSKNGKPIGEVYQDTYGWGCFHYKADNGADGMSSKEEALEQLKDMHTEHRQQGVAEGSISDLLNKDPTSPKFNDHSAPRKTKHSGSTPTPYEQGRLDAHRKKSYNNIHNTEQDAEDYKTGYKHVKSRQGVEENKLPKPYKKWAS